MKNNEMNFSILKPPEELIFLNKACESYKSALKSYELKLFNSTANRLYYAAYQLAVEFFVKEGILPWSNSNSFKISHGEVPIKLRESLEKKIKPEIFKKLISWFPRMYSLRCKADYTRGFIKEYELKENMDNFETFSELIYNIIIDDGLNNDK